MQKKVALVFGGKSAEHEISFLSVRNVYQALDRQKFAPILLGISKEGSWYHCHSDDVLQAKSLSDATAPETCEPVVLCSQRNKATLISLSTHKQQSIDIAFPVLHGTYGEDGTIQGLFKMANLPFVGCGVFSSAASMDKEIMKRLLAIAKIPTAKYNLLTSEQKVSYAQLAKELGQPFFIKPASLGSSVGVFKIRTENEFSEKLKIAFSYDHKVLAEEFIEGREIECSVIGLNHSPKASLPGELIINHEFYSYEAKYLDEKGASPQIPAKLSEQQIAIIQDLARQTFTAMACDGLARVDFFLSKDGRVLVNELNTLPGFTQISMYPKMWEASGLSYPDLITQLIELGFEKFQSEQTLSTSY